MNQIFMVFLGMEARPGIDLLIMISGNPRIDPNQNPGRVVQIKLPDRMFPDMDFLFVSIVLSG